MIGWSMRASEPQHAAPSSKSATVDETAGATTSASLLHLDPAAVLGLQTTAGNNATARMLQRREYPDSAAASAKATRDWTTSDRKNNTAKWQAACEDNLLNKRNGDYKQIAERRDFYKWFYEATAAKGFETRWALAAYIVAGGMAEMAEVDWTEGLSPITNELQGLTRIGNQVIFDDALPKLHALYVGPPLKGADARKWDEQVLAEEQNLISHLYKGLSKDAMTRFAGMADMTYWRAQFGAWIGMGGSVAKGTYNIAAKVPTFSSLVPGGDINKPEDRWKYGMALAKKFSTLPDYGPLDPTPAVGAAYSTSAQFDKLNVRPHIHMIDAMLNDIDIPEDQVVKQLKALSASEQREIFDDPMRPVRIGGALSYKEMKDGIGTLEHVPIAFKLLLLEFALVRSWTSVTYKELKPMIELAAKHHPGDLKLLHTNRWKKVFLDVCDDDTIDEAVVDIQLPAATAEAWKKEEKAIF